MIYNTTVKDLFDDIIQYINNIGVNISDAHKISLAKQFEYEFNKTENSNIALLLCNKNQIADPRETPIHVFCSENYKDVSDTYDADHPIAILFKDDIILVASQGQDIWYIQKIRVDYSESSPIDWCETSKTYIAQFLSKDKDNKIDATNILNNIGLSIPIQLHILD